MQELTIFPTLMGFVTVTSLCWEKKEDYNELMLEGKVSQITN